MSHAATQPTEPGDALPGTDARPASYAFDRHEIDIGPAVRQTVLTGFLLGGEVADLAVVTVEEEGGRRLRIYAFEGRLDEEGSDIEGSGKAGNPSSPDAMGTWALRKDVRLRPDVIFVDVARIDGRDRLITGEPGRLNAWDPGSDAEHELVSVKTATAGFKAP